MGNAESSFTDQLQGALQGHQWAWAALVAYGLGLLTSLTPCVYPLIPITIGLFGGKDVAQHRGRSLGLVSCYVLGLSVMYTGLGLFVGFTGSRFGAFLSNPWVMLPVIVFFVLMALSLFGAFSLQLPMTVQAALTKVGGRGGGGAFLMGLVAGLVAAPCTGPPLAALLAFVGTQRSVSLGGLLLFCYSLGIGTLFFVLAGFALKLPRSGRWMEAVKSVMGVMLLEAALYFSRNLLHFLYNYGTQEIRFLVAHLGLLGLGIFIGGIHLRFGTSRQVNIRKAVGLFLITLGGFGVLAWQWTPRPLPWLAKSVTPKTAFARAQKEQKPLFVDFTASWCNNCHHMENKIFPQPAVKKELMRFLMWKVDCSTQEEKDCKELHEKYKLDETLPSMLILDPNGHPLAHVRGKVSAEELLSVLQKIK